MKYLAIGIVIIFSQAVFAQGSQEDTSEEKENKHYIYTELLGRTIIFGSLNYEYSLHPKVSIGCGLGYINMQQGKISRNVDGDSETGDYFDLISSQMIFANYFVGKRKHKFVLTGGITNFLNTYRNTYPTEKLVSRKAQVEWNAGMGYQFSTNRFLLRLNTYAISMPDPSGWYPKYFPWLGLSVGVKI